MEISMLNLEFASQYRNVDLVRAALQGVSNELFGKESEQAADIVMAANEALNNAVEHTSSSVIRVELAWDETALSIFVISYGPPFDPVAASAGLSMEDMLERDEGGYGLFLIRELVDRFDYEYKDEQNIWKLYKFANSSERRETPQ